MSEMVCVLAVVPWALVVIGLVVLRRARSSRTPRASVVPFRRPDDITSPN